MEITKNIVDQMLAERLNPDIMKHVSAKRKRYITKQQPFFVLLDLIKHKYKLDKIENEERNTTITEGFVYIVTNPAFPGYVKVGNAIDVYKRLNSYQTSDPHRKFKIEHYMFFHDRRMAEKLMHKILALFSASGEWFKIDTDTVIDIMNVVGCSRDQLTNDKDIAIHNDIEKIVGVCEFTRIMH